jgi:NDP-mannose synthase
MAVRIVPPKRPTVHRGGRGFVEAVILAGGRGTRLAPYTSVLPKPLMPIGDRSILEIILEQLADHGIRDVTLCVGYLSHLIRAVLDGRSDERLRIRYLQEDAVLGTAGPLARLGPIRKPFIVMNGDVLTTLDYRELVRFHRRSGNLLTIAARRRVVKIDFGVIHVDGDPTRVVRYEEKPEVVSTVSMGIYVLEPGALAYIPCDRPFDFPDLVQALLREGQQVGMFLADDVWFDIGRQEDYERAAQAWSGRASDVDGDGAAAHA